MADVILKEEETIVVSLSEEETINVSLEEEETLDVELADINYIPGYQEAEKERRANEEERIAYYEDFKERVENGEFDGKDGAIQYTAGTNIEITEDNVINCKVEGGGGISDEIDPTVPAYVKEITEEDISNWDNKSEFSGDYDDLTNKPTIPTVPTNVSEFTNDAGYLTEIPSEYVTESELDGKGYVTDLSNYYTKEETDTQISERTLSVYNAVGRLEDSVGNVEQLETDSKEVVGAINEIASSITPLVLTDMFYPVGSYYETSNTDFNPNTSWGGTWELEEDGTALVSKSATEGSKFNADIGTIVGSETHTLTVDELAEHDHTITAFGTTVLMNTGSQYGSWIGSGTGGTNATGGGQPHNNVQPSKIVNRWHRTA